MTKEEQEELDREIVYPNKESAVIKLNLLTIEPGEIIKLKYKTETGRIDTLCAIGTDSGIGPDCYSIISTSNTPIITDIVTEYPDISSLIQGQVYIYKDTDEGKYYEVYYQDGEKVQSELTDSFYFDCMSDGKKYYFDNSIGCLDISKNLEEKAGFQGISCISKAEYLQLELDNNVQEDLLYITKDNNQLTGLYYNGLPFKTVTSSGEEGSGVDKSDIDDIKQSLQLIQQSIDALGSRMSIQESEQDADSWEEL